MTGILGQLKWESLKKRRKHNRLILLYKVLKVKPVYQQMTLSPKLGVVEISTLWHFRLPLLIQMFIKVASSPRLSGIGMPSPILWSHLLKMQRIMLLSSLLWWELGTNSLITGPGEWLSFRHFTSKLSWSWSLPFYLRFISNESQANVCPKRENKGKKNENLNPWWNVSFIKRFLKLCEWMNEWVGGWVNEWMNEWEWMNLGSQELFVVVVFAIHVQTLAYGKPKFGQKFLLPESNPKCLGLFLLQPGIFFSFH